MPTRAAPTEVELVQISLPLARPFVTRHGTRAAKDAVLVRVRNENGTVGWGECAAEATPTYHYEYVDGVWAALRDHLVPRLFAGAPLDEVAGHPMAKAALRMATTDAALRDRGVSLATHLGGARTHVPVGVVVERYDDPERAADVAEAHVAEGYRRIKLKIAPGADVAHVDAVRRRIGRNVALWADANGAYSPADVDTLAALDVDLLEQPLRAGDLLDHAALVGRIPAAVCLDESIETFDDARMAIHVRAADALTVKPGRIGGIDQAVALHDLCREHAMPLWCGGMLETGIGRAANLALASLPGFTLPGDISASRRYVARDITEPFELEPDGTIAVPTGAGLGVTVDEEHVAAITVRREVLRPS